MHQLAHFVKKLAALVMFISISLIEYSISADEVVGGATQVRTEEAADYSFTPGHRLLGGDNGGMMTSCGVLQIGKPCKEVKVSDKFAEFMSENIPRCVGSALRAQGLGSDFEKITVSHFGTYADRNARNGSKKSMHATGRAIDISRFDINLKDGSTFSINMTAASMNKPFYRSFITCWQARNAERSGCGGRGRDAHGAVDARNRLHRSHVHLSMPFCPKQNGITGT